MFSKEVSAFPQLQKESFINSGRIRVQAKPYKRLIIASPKRCIDEWEISGFCIKEFKQS